MYAFGSGAGPNDLFFLFIDSNTAAFGHRAELEKMLNVRYGGEEGLMRNDKLFPLINETNGSGAVWAVLNPAYTRLAMKQQTLVVPTAGPAFRLTGPVWGPSARGEGGGQSLYFTLHDDRLPESARADGGVAYDWIIRADPFTGSLEPVAAQPDQVSEGAANLVGGSRELAITYGCCGEYSVQEMRFAKPIR